VLDVTWTPLSVKNLTCGSRAAVASDPIGMPLAGYAAANTYDVKDR
jgi:hypothetical protein